MKKAKQLIRACRITSILWLVAFIGQNIFFTIIYGWHLKPQSAVELAVDALCNLLLIVAAGCWLASTLKTYSYFMAVVSAMFDEDE